MVPLNNSERRSSFFLFLTFFIVTTGIILLTAFYGFRVPVKENEQLKQKIEAYQKEQVFAQQFETKLFATNNMFDKVNLPNADPATESYITLNLNTLSQMGIDTATHGKLYLDICQSLSKLDNAKKTSKDNGSNDVQIQKLKSDNADLQRSLSQCTVNLAQLERK